ncbi:hypothetical protein N7499_000574 [Penicillium canescens]|nr:hypothetical protein N7522_006151 [Penicillium canescens]KAJ6029426.1 hypothetical protein N7444_012413 [Penicillium canescens]KAJ6100944.1 hypothetical protein N7499_000574 [Penicillium canescens]KAJ6173401.1 hypothetical protein N7485_006213 [Penicillium canescens]
MKYPWDDVAFSYNQRRQGDAAALPPRLIKNCILIAGTIFTMCSNSATNVLEYYLPSYYVREHSPIIRGYLMIPIVVVAIVGMLLCGSGTSTIGYNTPFRIFSSLLTPIFASLIAAFGAGTSFVRLILYPGASGFASGIYFNALITAVQAALLTDDVSLGLSVVLFAQHLGPAVSVAIALTFYK